MNLSDLLLIAVVALVFGTLAQLTSGYSRGGWLVNLGLGFAGAFAGVILARSVTVPLVYVVKFGTVEFPIVWSIIGSVFFLAAIGLFLKPGRR